MFDIETIGTEPEAVVISVGAVNFNINGIIAKKLWVLNQAPQKAAGRREDAETLAWWASQSKDAKSVFNVKKGLFEPKDFIDDMKEFLADSLMDEGETFSSLKPIGNGANFDITILEHFIMMFSEGKKAAIPWKFYNVWCFRTFDKLTRCKEAHPREGVHHDALDDATYQAECFIKALNKNRKKS